MTARRLPKLRPVESIVVPDSRYGSVLVLRDPQGIAPDVVQIPPALVPIVARFDGTRDVHEIAEEIARELGTDFPHEVVVQVERALEQAGFLESKTFERKLREAQRAFDAAAVRASAHAGGGYPGSAAELRSYIEERCVPLHALTMAAGFVRGLCAPHIDPWRGARGYGAAYHALAAALDPEADTFLVLGTSHAPMREPFALCKKAYATPLGELPCDESALDELARGAGFDAYHDRLNHKKEHSIEFQAVFLRHLLGTRPATIVPVLAGLGASQGSGRSPRKDANAARFLDAMAELVHKRGRRMVVVAGVDLAHVGPRFGDRAAADAKARDALEHTDRESMARFAAREREGFWEHVAGDLDVRRVCGLAPMYSLLWTLGAGTAGTLVHYEQSIDSEDGSIVSHAAVTFSS